MRQCPYFLCPKSSTPTVDGLMSSMNIMNNVDIVKE